MDPKPLLHPPNGEVLISLDRIRSDSESIARLLDWYIDSVRSHFAIHGLPTLKGSISSPSSLHDTESIVVQTQSVLSILCDAQRHYYYPLKYVLQIELESTTESREFQVLDLQFQSALSAVIDMALNEPEFQLLLHMLIDRKLDECCDLSACESGSDPETIMVDSDGFSETLELMRNLREQSRALGIQSLCRRITAEVYYNFIQKYVKSTFHGKLDRDEDEESALSQLSKVISERIGKLIAEIVDPDPLLETQMLSFGSECLAQLRISEMFDIVVNFPDSIPALEDLRACMKTQEHRSKLASSFQNSCQQRLLHCGANTPDIITVYISTIKVFTLLEPRGVLLDKVARPIRRYLRDREDTVRCVVAGLLMISHEQENSSLSILGKELESNAGAHEIDDIDGNDYADIDWVPNPVDAAPDFRNRKDGGFVGSLLSLYEGKEVFVKEILNVLAERLLKLESYEMEEIKMRLELLKLRLGESRLLKADVMVRDIAESKRADANVQERLRTGGEQHNVVHGSVLSKLFWPKLVDEEIALPKQIEQSMTKYQEKFSALKIGRKLSWLKRLGMVDVTVELEDRTIRKWVTPEQATVIDLFGQRASIRAEDLQKEMKVDEAVVRRAVTFWVKEGVLKEEEKNRYIVLEKAEEGQAQVLVEDLGASSGVQSAEERQTEEMRVYWSYIVGMLTNLQALPVSRIHAFLKMLIPKEIGYERSEEELDGFLKAMVGEERLEAMNGNYRLRK
ncbi:uncharacterized protein V1516DRAFT_623972 [Lipomyces oligophaga]|uniref:uncharacterized protein n=1 Tax=Lipomyces oligophaga TaxID=45792 RepID=UPI0034CD188D